METGKSGKILVVDDEEMMREAATIILTEAGFYVIEAEGGAEATEKARQDLPDLILCDVQMPQVDGFQVIETLKQTPSTAGIPFIFLTGLADRKNLRKGMQYGADDYLTKPFTSDELLRAVGARLEKRTIFRKLEDQKLEQLRESISLSFPHELRTPLTSILGFSEILTTSADQLSREDLTNIGSRIQKSAKRLHHCLENFILLTESRMWAADPERVRALRKLQTPSWGLVVNQVAKDCAEKFGRADDLVLHMGHCAAAMKEEHARKIIFELVDNAFKFSSAGKPVEVSVTCDRESVTTRITNHGKEMSLEEIQGVGAFVQFGRKRSEQQGSGVGLALVRSLVELYGGTFSIESSVDKGTTVRITVPRSE